MPIKVLTVDDSRTIRIIVKKAFKPYDAVVIEAENGVEGLAKVQQEKPDLIVLDITMPVMTGIEMLNKLKLDPAAKNIPVIMLTAESGKDNVMQIIQMGVSNYIVKPFKGEQLIERAKTIIQLEPKKEEVIKQYLSEDGHIRILTPPSRIVRAVITEVETYLGPEMKKSGFRKLVLDLSEVTEATVLLVKLILTVNQVCAQDNISMGVLCSPVLLNNLKKVKEIRGIPLFDAIKDIQLA